ncbi:MAG: hypothetical protein DMG21_01090 [Acidobacteria bacterium]|nr:MAG: hypothetical protein DMG21_01090 [Acidobacteriota bacterium]
MAEVSVVIPARNEEANIERVVRSVAAQEDVREIIVVDDGSEDGTPRILERLKREIPALRVIRNDSLPEGWVGKNYALATGARVAQGDWLLFTDADTFHKPGSLKELLARAKSEDASLLSVSPGQQTPTAWEKAVLPYIFVCLSRLYRFEEVSDPASPRAAANGQFLLIRREVLEDVGGFDAIRGELLEDVALARRVKRAGGRLIFFSGGPWIETHMYARFADMWDGWTKNLYLLYEKHLGRALMGVIETVVLDVVLLAAFLLVFASAFHLTSRWVEKAIPPLLVLQLARTAWYGRRLGQVGFRPVFTLYAPLGGALYVLLLLNSIRAYQWGGRVSWKGRTYPAEGTRSTAR